MIGTPRGSGSRDRRRSRGRTFLPLNPWLVLAGLAIVVIIIGVAVGPRFFTRRGDAGTMSSADISAGLQLNTAANDCFAPADCAQLISNKNLSLEQWKQVSHLFVSNKSQNIDLQKCEKANGQAETTKDCSIISGNYENIFSDTALLAAIAGSVPNVRDGYGSTQVACVDRKTCVHVLSQLQLPPDEWHQIAVFMYNKVALDKFMAECLVDGETDAFSKCGFPPEDESLNSNGLIYYFLAKNASQLMQYKLTHYKGNRLTGAGGVESSKTFGLSVLLIAVILIGSGGVYFLFVWFRRARHAPETTSDVGVTPPVSPGPEAGGSETPRDENRSESKTGSTKDAAGQDNPADITAGSLKNSDTAVLDEIIGFRAEFDRNIPPLVNRMTESENLSDVLVDALRNEMEAFRSELRANQLEISADIAHISNSIEEKLDRAFSKFSDNQDQLEKRIRLLEKFRGGTDGQRGLEVFNLQPEDVTVIADAFEQRHRGFDKRRFEADYRILRQEFDGLPAFAQRAPKIRSAAAAIRAAAAALELGPRQEDRVIFVELFETMVGSQFVLIWPDIDSRISEGEHMMVGRDGRHGNQVSAVSAPGIRESGERGAVLLPAEVIAR